MTVEPKSDDSLAGEHGEVPHLSHHSFLTHLQTTLAKAAELTPNGHYLRARLTTLDAETHEIAPEDIENVLYDHRENKFWVFLKGHKTALVCSAGAIYLAAKTFKQLTHSDAPSGRS